MTDSRLPICDGCGFYPDDGNFPKSGPVQWVHCACRRAYDEGGKREAGELDLNTLANVRESLVQKLRPHIWKDAAIAVIDELIDACPVPFDEDGDEGGQ